MSAHTPGPWRLCVGSGAIEIRGEPSTGQSNPRVCRVLRSDCNCDANARLIAAAPEMLAALRAVQMSAVNVGGRQSVISTEVVAHVDAVVAKAAGAKS